MFILSDELLNKLNCSVCFKYLSVKPIKIYRNRAIKCGRCSEDDDGGVVSLYEKIVENGLFPCINRYEGCMELLAYSSVEAHEAKCISSQYSCPICSSEFSSYHFVQHYKREHSNSLLEKPEILLPQDNEYENYYMYKENDMIYILHVRCNLAYNCFFVNAACLGYPERVHRIKQYIKCYLGDSTNSDNLCLQTRQRDCSLIEHNSECFKIPFSKNANLIMSLRFCFDTTSINFINNLISIDTIGSVTNTNDVTTEVVGPNGNKYSNKIFLSDDFKKMYQKYSVFDIDISLVQSAFIGLPKSCTFCENILIISNTSLYKCEDNHLYCEICWEIRGYCYLGENEKDIELATAETNIYRLLQFYCRFNCGKLLLGGELSTHEDLCVKNDCLKELSNYLNVFLFDGKTHFGSTSNAFLFKEYGFRNGEKIFVKTRDYFIFLLHSSYENNKFKFWVTHCYPQDEIKVVFKTEDTLYDDDEEEFYISEDENLLGFAVVLRWRCK